MQLIEFTKGNTVMVRGETSRRDPKPRWRQQRGGQQWSAVKSSHVIPAPRAA